MDLILASTSRYRAELISRLGVPFKTAKPQFDEAQYEQRFYALDDEAFAIELAVGKAASLRAQAPGCLILAADQIAVAEVPSRRLLHKPGTVDRAVTQLMSLAGSTHTLVTAVVLMDAVSGEYDVRCDRVDIRMRPYGRAEAEAYVRRSLPLDCVGSYRVEDGGICLMDQISGADPTSIMGLPLLAVCALLRARKLLPV